MDYHNYYFDVPDDAEDSYDSTNEQLNEYYLSGHLDMILNEQYCQDQQPDDVKIETMDIEQTTIVQDREEEEEEILSQKLSQLSTTTNLEMEEDNVLMNSKKRSLNTPSSSPDVIPKKIKYTNTDENNEFEKDLTKIPFNLSISNSSFIHLTQQILDQNASSMTIDDIQQLALLIYHLGLFRIHKQITMAYFKSGMGTLCDPEPDLDLVDCQVWPAIVLRSVTLTEPKNSSNEAMACEQFIYERLQLLNKKLCLYQQEYDDKKKYLVGFTSTMQQVLEDYVHRMVIMPLKLKRDMKIESLKFDFDIEIMERKFLRENPNQYQIDIAKRICTARDNYERVERQIMELKQRMIYNKPIRLLYSLPQKQHSDVLMNQLLKLEKEYYVYKKLYNSEMSIMWSNHRNLVRDKDMPTQLSKLIEQRVNRIAELWQKRFDFRFKYFLLYSFDECDVSFQSYIFSYMQTSLTHIFNQQQLTLLSRGPTYVPPCQSHSITSLDNIMRQQYAPLKHQLAFIFDKYKISVTRQFIIEKDVFEQFKRCFSRPLPMDLQKRTMYERQIVQSIHETLTNHQLILRRTADNLNTFYLGYQLDFEIKADTYLQETTTIYEVVHISNRENYQRDHMSQTRKTIDFINNSLKILKRRKDIDEQLYNRLYMRFDQVKLSYLYFLPEIISENVDIKLVPFISSSQYHMTYKISQYLNQILRPFAHEHMTSDVFRDELDFIQQFHTYNKVNSNTLFCTMKILNYTTLDIHNNIIATIHKFIQDNVPGNRLGKILLLTIKNLLQLCLCHTMFSYKNKLFKFLKGAPTLSPLMDTLSNIYLYVYQQKIFFDIKERNEFFGRFKDELFFTWHQSREDFDRFIETIQKNYPHFEIQTLIGTTVQYLNASISIDNCCHIKSDIYHDINKQIYALPYVIGHTKVQYSNWIRSTLIRAICYCSSVEDFNRERIRIELAMYANGYSYEFVETRIKHFYDYFFVGSLRYDLNQSIYNGWRQNWFKFVDTRRQIFYETLNCKDQQDFTRFFYLYEYGKRCDFNKQFQLLWLKHFHEHPILGKNPMIVFLFTKHLYSLNTLLAQM